MVHGLKNWNINNGTVMDASFLKKLDLFQQIYNEIFFKKRFKTDLSKDYIKVYLIIFENLVN